MADTIFTYKGRIPTLGGGNRIPYFDKQSPLLLDTYTNSTFAFSLRKLSSTYLGSAIRIRRSSDDTETDIGFDANGNLDESSITSFVGANSAYVTTWYDQSGNGRNATQTTVARQPRIVNSGTIDEINARPSIYFGPNGTNYFLSLPTGLLNGSTTLSYFNVVRVTDFINSNAGVFAGLWYDDGVGNPEGFEVLQVSVISRPTFLRFNNVARNDNAAAAYRLWDDNTQTILEIYGNSTSTSAYKNNTSVTLTNSSAMPTLNFNGVYAIGKYYNSASADQSMSGYHQELIVWNTDQVSNRSVISADINSYYSIY
jgi:hypothetical protein